MKKNTNMWIWIAAVAAAVAAVTTIVILLVRARQKAQNIIEPIYDCGCCDDTCCEDAADAVEEPAKNVTE